MWVPPAPPSGGQYTNSNLIVENARWVPFLNWAGRTDTLVPIAGPCARSRHASTSSGCAASCGPTRADHFDLAGGDEWGGARSFLAASVVERDPYRVDYAFVPAADRSRLGLVHDHAYWISHLRVRDAGGDPATDPARGEISAVSRAFGFAPDPVTKRVTSAGDGTPPPESVSGTDWVRTPRRAKRNAIGLRLENTRRAHVDGRRARLHGDRCLRVSIQSDGAFLVRLTLPFPGRPGTRTTARAYRGGSCRRPGAPTRQVLLSQGGATILARGGSHRWVILPR